MLGDWFDLTWLDSFDCTVHTHRSNGNGKFVVSTMRCLTPNKFQDIFIFPLNRRLHWICRCQLMKFFICLNILHSGKQSTQRMHNMNIGHSLKDYFAKVETLKWISKVFTWGSILCNDRLLPITTYALTHTHAPSNSSSLRSTPLFSFSFNRFILNSNFLSANRFSKPAGNLGETVKAL